MNYLWLHVHVSWPDQCSQPVYSWHKSLLQSPATIGLHREAYWSWVPLYSQSGIFFSPTEDKLDDQVDEGVDEEEVSPDLFIEDLACVPATLSTDQKFQSDNEEQVLLGIFLSLFLSSFFPSFFLPLLFVP